MNKSKYTRNVIKLSFGRFLYGLLKFYNKAPSNNLKLFACILTLVYKTSQQQIKLIMIYLLSAVLV